MRILVCGGRDFRDKEAAFSALDAIRSESIIHCVIHGGANGADYIAGRWAETRGIPCEEYPADWRIEGRSAGPKRNQKMIDLGSPDLVVAFAGGRGTADMVSRADRANIPVKKIG